MVNKSYKNYRRYRKNKRRYTVESKLVPAIVLFYLLMSINSNVKNFLCEIIIIGMMVSFIYLIVKSRTNKVNEINRIENNEEEKEMKSMSSTEIGYINKNNQKNIGKTNEPGTGYMQWFYNMECLNCGHIYKANGHDIWLRKCPSCQGGAK